MATIFKLITLVAAAASCATLAAAVPQAITPDRVTRQLTNGERLARGLPLNKPVRRAPGQLRARASPTPPSVTSYSAPPAPTPTSASGIIQISGGNDTIGQFLSSTTFTGGGLYNSTDDRSQALQISASYFLGSPSDFVTTNGNTTYPYLGAIVGPSNEAPEVDLRVGTYNYACIVATTAVPDHTDAQEVPSAWSADLGKPAPAESAFWLLDPSTGALTPQWTNGDNKLINGTFFYEPKEQGFCFAPDFDEVTKHFAPTVLVPVNLTLVSA